jgi:LPXTG-motif cell wall-anchored protein
VTTAPAVTTSGATLSGTTPPIATGKPSGSTLPDTGFDVVALTAVGLLLLAGGALLRRKGSRPRHH